jgi:hypothetical protein
MDNASRVKLVVPQISVDISPSPFHFWEGTTQAVSQIEHGDTTISAPKAKPSDRMGFMYGLLPPGEDAI